MYTSIEENFEGQPLELQQQFRDLMRKKYNCYDQLVFASNVGRCVFSGLVAIDMTLLVATPEITVSNGAGPIAIGTAGTAITNLIRKWTGDRRMHAELDLRSIERVIDRRIGYETELED